MKSAIFNVLVALAFGCYSVLLTASPATYSIGVHFPENENDYACGVPAYYKGHKINLSRWTPLPAGKPCSILITPSVSFKTHGNTIQYLKRNNEAPFLWYDLTLTFSEEEDEAGNKKTHYDWTICERDQESLPLRVPEHTLVVLVDPSHIEGLVVEPVVPNGVDVMLPTIYFKDDLHDDILQDCLLNSLMESMDLDAIHCKTCPSRINCKECVVITTAKPVYESRS